MSVGENIKKYRISKDLTQKQLAELSGVAEVTIRQYESEKRIPRTVQLLSVADALGVSPFDLHGEKPPINYNDGKLTIKIDDKSMLVDPVEFQDTINDIVNRTHPTKKSTLLNAFDKLNRNGQNEAIKQVNLLAKIPEYQKGKE